MVAGAEGSSGAEWLHGHHRRYGDVYVNQGEEYPVCIKATCYLYIVELHVCRSKLPFQFLDFFDL